MEETVRERRTGAGRRPGRGRGARGRRGVSSGFIRALDSALCRPVPLQVTAGQLRERGNALFQAGDHAAALAAYTQALSLCQAEPERAVLHRNRAACYLKLVRAGGRGAGRQRPARQVGRDRLGSALCSAAWQSSGRAVFLLRLFLWPRWWLVFCTPSGLLFVSGCAGTPGLLLGQPRISGFLSGSCLWVKCGELWELRWGLKKRQAMGSVRDPAWAVFWEGQDTALCCFPVLRGVVSIPELHGCFFACFVKQCAQQVGVSAAPMGSVPRFPSH